MVFGSLGVGWLAPVSELRRVPIFIWMRTEAVGVALAIVLVAVGGMLLVRSWLRLGQRVRVWGRRRERQRCRPPQHGACR
ncbi:conserved hypothetical protein [Arthrobacter sp. Hiyo4]|nr:conserved hypothetical protein [Arthrobacter sp. Hiyo4]